MPTRRRETVFGTLKPSVLAFLEDGSTAQAEREISKWVVMTLMSTPAIEARRLWAAGDKDGAIAALRRAPQAHHLFVRADAVG